MQNCVPQSYEVLLKPGFTLYTNDDETMLITKRCTMRNSMCTEKLSHFRGNKSQAVVKKTKNTHS